ncbi:tetratricopeptide repeat protein [Phormidesmis sp. 146-12]
MAEDSADWEAVITFRTRQAKYLAFQGHLLEAEEMLEANIINSTLAKIESSKTCQRARVKYLVRRARLLQKRKSEEALNQAEIFLEEARLTVEKEKLSDLEKRNVLDSLGAVLQDKEDFKRALEIYQEVNTLNQSLDDKYSIARGLNCEGFLLGKLSESDESRFAEALNSYKRSIEASKELKQWNYLAISLEQLSRLYERRGDKDQAIYYVNCELQLWKDLKDERREIVPLERLAKLSLLLEPPKTDEAQKAFQRRVAIAEKIGNLKQTALCLMHLGGFFHRQRDLEDALNNFIRVFKLRSYLESQENLASTLRDLSNLFKQRGNFSEAKRTVEYAIEIYTEIDHLQELASSLNIRGLLHKRLKNYNDALHDFNYQIEISLKLNDQKQLEHGLRGINSLLDIQEWDEAEKSLEEYRNRFDKLQEQRNLLVWWKIRAESFENQNKYHEAEDCYSNVLSEAKKFSDSQQRVKEQVTALCRLGQLYAKNSGQESLNWSVNHLHEAIKIASNTQHLEEAHAAVEEALRGAIQGTNRRSDVLNYCDEILQILPAHSGLSDLRQGLVSSIKTGLVLHIKTHPQNNYRWGHIAPHDGGKDIYFSAKYIGTNCLSQLQKGTLVEVEVETTNDGYHATHIRILK